MKISHSPFLIFALLLTCLLIPRPAEAQNKGNQDVMNEWAAATLKIDGNLNDWGDSLKLYHENTRFSFNISNNKDYLYMAIKSRDKNNLSRILARGISFSVNTEGKKKPGQTIVFPVFARGSQIPKPANLKTKEEIQKNQEQILSKINQLRVYGFTDVLDGAVSLNNTYGISAAANFDGQDNMVIEIAIPFQLLKISNINEPISCLIEINGIKPPKSTYNPDMYPRRNRRYGGYDNRNYDYERRPSIDKQLLSTGFWIKSTLAKNP